MSRATCLTDDLIAATNSKVPAWAALTAQLGAVGFRVVPPDTWPALCTRLAEDAPEEEQFGKMLQRAGFVEYSNHCRGDAHESWQSYVLGATEKENADARAVPVWVIPYNELNCIAHDDELYDEFVTLYRYLFVGTEQELRTALASITIPA